MYRWIFIPCLFLASCQNTLPTGKEAGFYAYMDAQGNLITSSAEPATVRDGHAAPPREKREAPGSNNELGSEDLAGYRPSEEVDADIEARERNRFITYVDETGQLVSRPLDMKAEKEGAASRPQGYEVVPSTPYLETYRAIRADCCGHLLSKAKPISPGQEQLLEFDDNGETLIGETPFRAQALAPAADVQSFVLKAFIRNKSYLAVQLLWLDEQGMPLLLVDQPFSREYPETWYRYGYLEGTLQREKGQHYLVVFLPYIQSGPATDGLEKVLEGELLLSAQ